MEVKTGDNFFPIGFTSATGRSSFKDKPKREDGPLTDVPGGSASPSLSLLLPSVDCLAFGFDSPKHLAIFVFRLTKRPFRDFTS